MIAVKGIDLNRDCKGCLSCVFHWNGDSTTYCLAQSRPNNPGGKRLHHINYDEKGNEYGKNGTESCYTWRESTCPLIDLSEGQG